MSTDPEIAEAATFLATHAVLLLFLGVVLVVAAVVSVVAAGHLGWRYRSTIARWTTSLRRQFEAIPHVKRLVAQSPRLRPTVYLAVQLAIGLVLVATIGGFSVIAEEVVSAGKIADFDRAFAQALRSTTSPGWERFFSFVTLLGSREMLVAGSVIVTLVVFSKHGFVLAAGWVIGQLGGALLNLSLKYAFARTRPEYADPLLVATSWSFPSAHAMNTFIFCGLGGYLLVRSLRTWVAAGVAATIAVVWCLLMGFSRLYLGVHFASDVIAGLLAGTAWVAVCVSAMETVRWRTRD